MPRQVEVNVGDPFGLWVVEEVRREKNKHTMCLCKCGCGTVRAVELQNLRQGKSRNCGCVRDAATAERNHKHGDNKRGSRSRLYRIWSGMLSRCSNESLPCYRYYGGKAIAVCAVWRADFVAFRDWAQANGYRVGLSIERNDVDGDYEPGNCRWIPWPKQARNRHDTMYLTAFGETKGIADWAEDPRCKVRFGTLKSRILRPGWSHEEAISTPKTHKFLRSKR